MKTLHLSDEERTAVECALRFTVSQPGECALRPAMQAVIEMMEDKPIEITAFAGLRIEGRDWIPKDLAVLILPDGSRQILVLKE